MISPAQSRRRNSAQGRISIPSSVFRARGARRTTMDRFNRVSSLSALSPRRWFEDGRSVDLASTATAPSAMTKSTSKPDAVLQYAIG